MIDAEFDIYDTISDALRDAFGENIWISGEYVDVPAKFPAATIIEADNSVYQKMRTTNIENAVQVMYEVNVYSNRIGYKKFEAKQIMAVIDNAFASINFTRIMMNTVSNLQDATIYRLVARYEGVIDKDLWIYTG